MTRTFEDIERELREAFHHDEKTARFVVAETPVKGIDELTPDELAAHYDYVRKMNAEGAARRAAMTDEQRDEAEVVAFENFINRKP